MPQQTVSVELPEDLYQRVCETAAAVARSVQDVLAAMITLSLPPLESDLPAEIRSELGPMAQLSTEELQAVSRESLDHERQVRLEALAERQKKQPLSDAERAEIDELVEQAQRVVLHRAEARRLLALCGHQIPDGLAAAEARHAGACCHTWRRRGTGQEPLHAPAQAELSDLLFPNAELHSKTQLRGQEMLDYIKTRNMRRERHGNLALLIWVIKHA